MISQLEATAFRKAFHGNTGPLEAIKEKNNVELLRESRGQCECSYYTKCYACKCKEEIAELKRIEMEKYYNQQYVHSRENAYLKNADERHPKYSYTSDDEYFDSDHHEVASLTEEECGDVCKYISYDRVDENTITIKYTEVDKYYEFAIPPEWIKSQDDIFDEIEELITLYEKGNKISDQELDEKAFKCKDNNSYISIPYFTMTMKFVTKNSARYFLDGILELLGVETFDDYDVDTDTEYDYMVEDEGDSYNLDDGTYADSDEFM